MMKKYLVIVAIFSVALSGVVTAGGKEDERLNNATAVLKEMMGMPDEIPAELLDKAECVVVIPSVKKLAIGFGGSYGRGAMVCRTGSDYSGTWGPPVMIALEGGSFGLQLGGSATDFVLMVMNQRGANGILSSKVKLGADATAAAGPKGRTAAAATDATMSAEILSYSRAKGLIAGISLEGSTLRPDGDANEGLYGQKIAPKEVVAGKMEVPAAAKGLVDFLNQKSPKNKSE